MGKGDEKNTKPNHLINEKSPYLVKHAYNPVDWYPWGEEAIEKARREDKPILLSIGYSTCHWCNVMEKESFSDPEIAAVMNKLLVNIKLDREERPDLDKIYITAVSALTGSAGWPLNVFLTPNLLPFFGGTYFPPEPRMGISGWVEIVKEIGRVWKNPERKKQILSSSEEIASSLRKFLSGSGDKGEIRESWIHDGFEVMNSSFDFRYGGFSKAPKFPVPVIHNFLLRYHVHAKKDPKQRENSKVALDVSLFSLKKMAEGGIFDHLGGGFHRYSTDERWHLPHFEKMLYDNGQLARAYLEAYQLTRNDFFAGVARGILDYILKDLSQHPGGFYSAEDADSLPPELDGVYPHTDMEHKKEGAYYVWSKKEIIDSLGKGGGEIFSFRYGAEEEGNVRYDPMDEFPGKNVLHSARTISETAREFNKTEEDVSKILDNGISDLYRLRSGRPKPHLDDKVITSWNGLAISAFSIAYQVLGERRYLEAAEKGATFIENSLFDSQSGQLYRRWRDGHRDINGMADDYAFLTQGLIDLYEACFDTRYLLFAVRLAEETINRFYDEERGGFFTTERGHDPNLIIRAKEEYDSVEPSPNAVATMNLLRLYRYTVKTQFLEKAENTLKYSSAISERNPGSALYMLSALMLYVSAPHHLVIVGRSSEKRTQKLLEKIRSRFIPSKVVMLIESDVTKEQLGKTLPFIGEMKRIGGKPTAYVCVDFTCRAPTSDPEEVSEMLDSISGSG